jgi:hypothetical protein
MPIDARICAVMRVELLWIGSALCAIGCGGAPAVADAPARPVDGAPGDAPGHTPGMPGLGGHGMAFFHLADPDHSPSTASISTPKLTTAASGGTIVVGVGRGDRALFALPTDTAGNTPYQQQGPVHPYTPLYPDSGTALYAFPSARGGPGFQVTASAGQNAKGQLDEITIAAVEVVEATRLQAFAWNEPTSPPLTSAGVTTTGPATLVAFWWGDGFPDTTSQTATAGDGFTVIDANVDQLHSFVQCAVAVKNVSAAGTYNVTWTATPEQGAQLWLVAVQ